MRYLLIIICVINFWGCTVPVNFYLQNTTVQYVEIIAHLNNNNLNSYNLRFQTGLPDLQFNLVKSFYDELKPYKIDGKYLHYKLPPMSTIFIGNGINFKNFTFDEIKIINNNGGDIVTLNWENAELLEKGKSFGLKYYAWYAIK